ncbi:MAG: class I SAM-dependent methyltransferase [Thermostichales cyanobacterium SZTDM-1c_bins_54]
MGPLQRLYDRQPYPLLPIEMPVRDHWQEQFKVHLGTAQYVRTHTLVSAAGKRLLNAGCGSGVETLLLAEANPGATIVALDFSATSVQVAEQRLRYHGFPDVEFYVMDLLQVGELGYTFDFITCNDTLYLLDDPQAGLNALAKVLHPEGILRANLHNYYGRRDKLEVQEALRLLRLGGLGLEEAVAQTRQILGAIKPGSWRRVMTWTQEAEQFPDDMIVNNFLLEGDKGYSVAETLAMLQRAGLDLVSWVDAASWDPRQIFTQMPERVQALLPELSLPEQWHLCELLYPNLHRLNDFWAEHRGSSLVVPWDPQDWQMGVVHLHPLLASNPTFRQQWQTAQSQGEALIFDWPGVPSGRMQIPPELLGWLEPLFTGPQPVSELLHDRDLQTYLAHLYGLELALFVFLEP